MRCILAATLVLATLASLGACSSDDGDQPIDGATGDILDQLRAQPEVASVLERPTQRDGYRYFEVFFTQPIDHEHPEAGTFEQEATLIHRDFAAPVVLQHSGYGNWYYDRAVELTELLHANQISIEHRFFRTSRPRGGPSVWQYLTIAQAAADHHVVATVLHRIYPGAFLETGASKGGMTAMYHRRFYPDDVDATVAYVAPLSIAAPDYRYDNFLDQLGSATCRDRLHAVQIELLRNRRPMLDAEARAQGGFNRIGVPAAVEGAVSGLEWAFWQYTGVDGCSQIPDVTASDADLLAFLHDVSPLGGSSDANVAEFEAYYYQAVGELGYPGTTDPHLDGLLIVPGEDYAGSYPAGVTLPAYRADVMADIDGWLRTDGERIVLLYGGLDPWSGGMFELGGATDSLRVVAPMGPHGSGIDDLTASDRDAVLQKLAAWSGVAPDVSVWSKRAITTPMPPRVPPRLWHRRDTTQP